MFDPPLEEAARLLADTLRRHGRRLVLAESCTAGLAAAALGQIPGISEFFCGSAVTYRNQSKHQWLGVERAALADPGPVSAAVAIQMAAGVLKRTPEAQLAVAVTGDLGPDAPPETDGVIFLGVAADGRATASRIVLGAADRRARQREAARLVLNAARDAADA